MPFDIAACKAMLARIMRFESGSEGFARVVDDGEFAGRFTHRAMHAAHAASRDARQAPRFIS